MKRLGKSFYNVIFTIFEKKEKSRENFGGIQLSPNATHILNYIGFQKLSSNNFCLPHSIDFLDLSKCMYCF